MKLLRYGAPGAEKPGLVDKNGKVRDLSEMIDDFADDNLLPSKLERLKQVKIENLPEITHPVRLGPCISNVGKFICIGLNYSDHASEAGMEITPEPIVFFKATSAICGPNDDIVLPLTSEKTDWEVELGVIIGKRAKYVNRADALSHVAGYCIINDLSERAFQLERSGQWVKGKSCDTFGPVGPWLVTKDEVPDPQNLRMWLEVDDRRYQDGSTQTMIFDVAYLISYLSQLMTLHPGDIISTGTPPGVGMAQNPPKYLKPGNTVRLGIDGLGEQIQQVTNFSD